MEETTGYSVSKLGAAEAAALLAAGAADKRARSVIDPRQIIMGLISACAIMIFTLLTCVLIAYLSMAALNSF